jgi:hypothetical protein
LKNKQKVIRVKTKSKSMYPFSKPPLDSQLKQHIALSVSPKHSENVDRLRRRNGYFPQGCCSSSSTRRQLKAIGGNRKQLEGIAKLNPKNLIIKKFCVICEKLKICSEVTASPWGRLEGLFGGALFPSFQYCLNTAKAFAKLNLYTTIRLLHLMFLIFRIFAEKRN